MYKFIANSLGKLPQLTTRNPSTNTFCKKLWFSENKAPVTEQEILSILKNKFPGAKAINVEDVSGGCGAMFNVFVETPEFKGLSIAKQHRSVYEVLNEQIKSIHGLHLETKAVK